MATPGATPGAGRSYNTLSNRGGGGGYATRPGYTYIGPPRTPAQFLAILAKSQNYVIPLVDYTL